MSDCILYANWYSPTIRFTSFASFFSILFSLFAFSRFFGQRSIANIDLAENFKIFDLDWNSSNDSFDVSDDSITQFLFFDNNHYVFRNHSSEKLLVSDQLNGNYFGSEVFENNTSGPERYLVFSPESNQSFPEFLLLQPQSAR